MKRQIILTLIISLMTAGISGFAQEASPNDYVALHIGSPLTLTGEDIKPLDSDNPNVVPVIHKDRTLVPLRAISEHFGAEVSYDSIKMEAVINFDGKTYTFPIDKNYYRIQETNKATKTMVFDTEALIIEGRTMVPLRVISEQVLGKSVEYNDDVITVGTKIITLSDRLKDDIKIKIGQAVKVTSLDQLNNIVASMVNNNRYLYEKGVMEDLQAPSMPTNNEGVSSPEATKDEDYSSTNEQVEGVNEADIVKTDGKFIYVALGKSIKIYKANDGKPVLVDEITMSVDTNTGQYVQLTEMYIDQGRLVVLGARNSFENWIRPLPEITTDMDKSIMPPRQGRSYSYAGIYSIDKNGKSNLIKEVEVEGSMLSSRKIDGTVYLVVNKYLNYYGIDPVDVVPMYRDTVRSAEYIKLPIDSIMYYPQRLSPNYLIIAAIDINDEKAPATIETLLGSGFLVYMSNNALYVAGQDYNTIWGTITNISKFTIDGTKIGFAGGGMVDGSILNQFSMDEYDGNLRIATTNWQRESKNALYVLDKNLNKIGSVENLAPGERIYSVRFMGDKGYIVTFRQIDPLFVIDISSPTAPKVVGELKVPGFSNYLHPLSEDILLGIGQNVDENTGRQEGIKLSIFDVSNQGKPKELNSITLGSSGSYAEVLNNHKALMLNLDDDMIAFDASLSSVTGDYEKGYFYGAVVMEVKENGSMTVLKQISSDNYGSYVKRLIYIGDVLYYIQDDQIKAYDMDNFKAIN